MSFVKKKLHDQIFGAEIYTAGKNFTKPLVATVVTNLNSDSGVLLQQIFILVHLHAVFLGVAWRIFLALLE